ncbi:MAG: transcription factor TFIIIB subunit brf1 [Vezdaea aestivalis]|nr:MAG: transcription factor TFIIIB subunit brf1 [Vezdaea aestivalis]
MAPQIAHKPKMVRRQGSPNSSTNGVSKPRPPDASKRRFPTVRTPAISASKAAPCPNPSCTDPQIEQHHGQQVCITCGTVVNDANIVSEVQFGESSSGAAVVEGVFIGPNEGHARATIPGGNRISLGIDSREKSDQNGRQKIAEIGAALSIHQPTRDTAFRIWMLCTGHNFIQGRRINQVAAVCLYIACRKMEKENKLMLIDFSDLIHVNVFKLGHVYTTLLQTVGGFGGVPSINIENLVYRFVEKLDLGDSKLKVAGDAVRLVQRMKKDWMAVGRRPAGVVGASVLLAARMNNFNRSVREMVHVAKVTDMTINKRLEEFKVTASSNLTIDEFRVMELEREHDPPAFYEERKGKKRKRGKASADPDANEEEDEDQEAAESTTSRAGSAVPQLPNRVDSDGFTIPALPAPPIDPSLLPATGVPAPLPTPPSTESEPPAKRRRGRAKAKAKGKGKGRGRGKAAPTPEEIAADEELAQEIERTAAEAANAPEHPPAITACPTVTPFNADSARNRAPAPGAQTATSTDAALASPLINDSRSSEHTAAYERAAGVAAQLMELYVPTSKIPNSKEIAPEEFDTDPEVVNCLLTTVERSIKERIWMAENEIYLREKQAKELAADLAAKEAVRRGVKRRKRVRKGKIGEESEATSGASTPAEAMKMMLKRRGFSTRINYDAVDRLLSRERRQKRVEMGLDPDEEENGGEEATVQRAVDEALEQAVAAEHVDLDADDLPVEEENDAIDGALANGYADEDDDLTNGYGDEDDEPVEEY